MKSFLRRAAAEPLVHFLVIGAVLFAGLMFVKSLQRPVVRLDAGEIEQLAQYWTLQMQRPPNKAELAAIINERVDEELLAREALRLGLDKDDMIIRRRLAQKMSFAADDLAAAQEPSDAQLRAYFNKTASRYAASVTVSFQQAFFSGDRAKVGAQAAAIAALGRAHEDQRDPVGDPFAFPLTYEGVSAQDLERDYGPAFVKALETAPVGEWSGPVVSPYGWHVIKVTARTTPPATSFDSVRDQVLAAWQADRRAQANTDFLTGLRKRYRVVVAGVDGK